MRENRGMIVVETQEDTLSGTECSLRAAVEAANTGSTVAGCRGRRGHNIIQLPAGEYHMTLGTLVVSGNMTIIGDPEANGASVIISGLSTASVITVTQGGRLTLFGVTITGGGGSQGAGIMNHGFVMVRNSTLTHNVANGENGATSPCTSTYAGNQDCAGGGGGGGAGLGGALYNTGRATLVQAVVSSNSAVGGDGGGSFYPLSLEFCDTGGQGGGPAGGVGGGYTSCFGEGTDGGAGGFGSGGGGGGAAASAGGNGGPGGFGGGGGGGGGGGRTLGFQNAHGGPGGFGGGAGGEPGGSAGAGGGGGAGIGGGVFNDGGIVHMAHCQFTDNQVEGGLGGAFGGAENGQGLCPDVFAYGGLITIGGTTLSATGCTANGGVIKTFGLPNPRNGDCPPISEAQ
ncbi:hypothetical protein [Sulfobacillus harzensis]|uniref:Uncharacterized protein n=1 Tax=Sulfobacillus harzensis TaxID=2729629 RepID=A0A7Y0L1V6_9FIRM|nr:hypothetical protein [Sulfobacillus harzensis]NMP21685.1 hypothetical protein [Sulfobacillus harzensis]